MKIAYSDKHHYLKQVSMNESRFAKRLRELVYLLWVGDIDQYEFYAEMNKLLMQGYRVAWEEGQESVGAGIFLPFYVPIINQKVRRDLSYVYGFAGFIEEHSRAAGGKLSTIAPRTELWINGYNKVKNLAKVETGQQTRLIWERHSKDGCSSCIALDGRVMTAKEWKANGLYPQHPSLACMRDAGGIPVCRCTLSVTDADLTPGPLPISEVRPWL